MTAPDVPVAAEDLTISQLLRRAAMIYLATPCLVPALNVRTSATPVRPVTSGEAS